MPWAGSVEWLGASVTTGARVVNLPAAVKNVLLKAFEADVITGEDVSMDGTIDPSALGAEVKLWSTALQQHAKTVTVALTDLEQVRFEQWLTSRLLKPKDITPSGKDINDLHVPTEMKSDMAKQGMSLPEEMAGLELSLYLGRPGARGELEGYEYGKPSTHMIGAIREKKTGSKVGWLSIDEVVVEGLAANDAADLTLFVQELAGRLSRSELLKSYKSAANQIQTWYNISRNSIADDDVLLTYVKLYRGQYQGRGLVTEFDPVLYIAAENKIKAMRAKKAKPLDLKDLASTVSGGSSHSSSVSTAYPDTSVSMQSQAQLSQLVGAVSGISSMLASMQSRLDSLEGAAGPPQGEYSCWECGSIMHKKEACPLFLQKQADKKKAAADKAAAEKAAAKK